MTQSPLDQPYRGGFIGAEHHFALTVYFEDTDAAGVVYYANYLRFMERARSDMIRAVGIDQAALVSEGGDAYYVADVAVRYLRPARLGDDLVVVIQQRVMRGTEQLTDGRVTAAYLDASGRPQRQPKHWVERFRKISRQEG